MEINHRLLCCSHHEKHVELWYHSFDPVKYKHYEGSLVKINFLSKVYSKSLLKGVASSGTSHLQKANLTFSSNVGEYTKFLYQLRSSGKQRFHLYNSLSVYCSNPVFRRDRLCSNHRNL